MFSFQILFWFLFMVYFSNSDMALLMSIIHVSYQMSRNFLFTNSIPKKKTRGSRKIQSIPEDSNPSLSNIEIQRRRNLFIENKLIFSFSIYSFFSEPNSNTKIKSESLNKYSRKVRNWCTSRVRPLAGRTREKNTKAPHCCQESSLYRATTSKFRSARFAE